MKTLFLLFHIPLKVKNNIHIVYRMSSNRKKVTFQLKPYEVAPFFEYFEKFKGKKLEYKEISSSTSDRGQKVISYELVKGEHNVNERELNKALETIRQNIAAMAIEDNEVRESINMNDKGKIKEQKRPSVQGVSSRSREDITSRSRRGTVKRQTSSQKAQEQLKKARHARQKRFADIRNSSANYDSSLDSENAEHGSNASHRSSASEKEDKMDEDDEVDIDFNKLNLDLGDKKSGGMRATHRYMKKGSYRRKRYTFRKRQ